MVPALFVLLQDSPQFVHFCMLQLTIKIPL
jgi:hypothetical protein